MDDYELYLYHYGVPGMKWGIRKAKKLIGMSGRVLKKTARYTSKAIANRRAINSRSSSKPSTTTNSGDPHEAKVAKAKKAVKVGAAVAGTVLAVYGAKKVHDFVRSTNATARHDQVMRSVEMVLGKTNYNTEQKGQMIRDGWKTAGHMAKNDSFGTALKNAAQYEIERRTRRR